MKQIQLELPLDEPQEPRRSWLYENHLRSDEWRRKRLILIARAHSRCQDCGKFSRHLDVHHLHYRNLGFEHDEDLRVLCRKCHEEADRERKLLMAS